MTTLETAAHKLIVMVIPYLEPDRTTLLNYESWVSNWNTNAGFTSSVAEVARTLLTDPDVGVVRSAMQALAVVGDDSDLCILNTLRQHCDRAVRNDVDDCIREIGSRMKTLDDLLDEIVDWKTFAAFVERLADERAQAEKIENASPNDPAYMVNGALGWNNGNIQQFLWAALSYFPDNMSDDDERSKPTWRNFAEMLYCGKIIE